MNDFFKTIRSFIMEYLPRQRCCSENTITAYRTALNLLIEFLRSDKQLKISQIDFSIFHRDVILSFLDWLKNSRNCGARTRNHRLMALRSFFAYAGIVDCTQAAIQLDVEKVPVKNVPERIAGFLTEDALKVLLEQPDGKNRFGLRNQFFMLLMYDTASRCSELLDMKIRDLRIHTRHPCAYLLGKGNKPRSVSLMNRTTEHCVRYLKVFHTDTNNDDYLFYTVIHGIRHRMSADNVAAFMRKYGNAARKICPEVPSKVHPHQLRHTRAIHYYRDGMPLPLIAELLGHASVETTKIYAYADTEMKRIAMEKAGRNRNVSPPPAPVWQDNEDMILELSGLKLRV
jgi:site-specific recombinase XerD